MKDIDSLGNPVMLYKHDHLGYHWAVPIPQPFAWEFTDHPCQDCPKERMAHVVYCFPLQKLIMSGQCRRIIEKPGQEAREYLEAKILAYAHSKHLARRVRRLVAERRKEAETESYQHRKAEELKASGVKPSMPGQHKPLISARAEPTKPENSADCQSQKSAARLQLAGRIKASRPRDNAVSVGSPNPVSSRKI